MERPNATVFILILGLLISNPAVADEMPSVLTYLRPYQSVEVSTTERGEIREVFVKPGEEVTKGSPLLRLDAENVEARLAISRAQASGKGRVLAAEAELRLNQERLSIVEKLQRRGTSNAAEYDRQKSLVEVSKANLIAAKEEKEILKLQVKSIEVELARRTLRSSIAGVVVEVARDAGEAINSVREDALVRIVEVDRLKARAFVPVRFVEGLAPGDEVKVLTASGAFLGTGEIEFISPLSDPATSTVEMVAAFDNRERKLPVGEQVQLVLGKESSFGADASNK